MRYRTIIILFAITLASCSSEDDITGSTPSACVAKLYSAYNPKDMNQCVAVCKTCDHGNTTTCTTSCTLRGAH